MSSITWMKMTPPPTGANRQPNPLYTIPTRANKQNYYVINGNIREDQYIWKYDYDNDKWNDARLMKKYDHRFDNMSAQLPAYTKDAFALDIQSNNNLMYVIQFADYSKKGCQIGLKHIELNKLKETVLINNKYIKSRGVRSIQRATGIVIDHKLHVIGGRNNSHVMWDEKSDGLQLSDEEIKQIIEYYFYDCNRQQLIDEAARMKYTVVCSDDNLINRTDFGLVYDEQKNKLLMFGGEQKRRSQRIKLNSIEEFDINTKKWHTLQVKLPTPMQCECTTAINNQYVLIFPYPEGIDQGKIYVYRIGSKKIYESKIKLPQETSFYRNEPYAAITIGNFKKDEMTVFGFVRTQWKVANISDHYFPPQYLLKIMSQYYYEEFVCLLDRKNGNHWKIQSSEIVDRI